MVVGRRLARTRSNLVAVVIAVSIGTFSAYSILRYVRRKKPSGKTPAKLFPQSSSCDIEDLVVSSPCVSQPSAIVLRFSQPSAPVDASECDPKLVPGVAQIFVKTFGCSHNISDSEVMLGLLVEYGYTIATSLETSDLLLINSCTVKNPSQDAMATFIRKGHLAGKPVVVAGCVPQAEPSLRIFDGVSLIGTSQIHRIVEVVEMALQGNTIHLLNPLSEIPLEMPKIRRNRYIEIIPISTGCLGSCTYCKTKAARGNTKSYSIESIVGRIESAVKDGVREIWLTSEDSGTYGLDLGTNIADLLEDCAMRLEQLAEELNERVMLRLGMANPPYIAEHTDRIIRVLQSPYIYKFLHLPVQSGSNRVLSYMVREYTREDFEEVVDALLQGVEHITLATDVICGFPHETDEDHAETCALIQKYRFPIVNISQFYPRPKTPAAKFPLINTKVVKQRSREVSEIFRGYRTTEFLLGTTQRVLFTLTENAQTIGHTDHYIKVVVPQNDLLLGKSSLVTITSVNKWHAEGFVVSPLDLRESGLGLPSPVSATTQGPPANTLLVSTN